MKVKITVRDWLSGKPVQREVEALKANDLITHLPTGMVIIGPFMRNKAEEAFEQCARICTKEQGWDFKSASKMSGRVKDQGRTLRANWADHIVGGKLR